MVRCTGLCCKNYAGITGVADTSVSVTNPPRQEKYAAWHGSIRYRLPMINHSYTNGPSFRSFQNRLPLDDDADDEFSRIITPETDGEFRHLECELQGSIKRIDRRYKQIIMDLRWRQAPHEEIAKVEEEKRQLIEHRKEECRKKVQAFLNEIMGEK